VVSYRKLKNRDLPPRLAEIAKDVFERARAVGLDFWEVTFEVLDSQELNEVAAYGGFPTRYPHWKFGMSYEELIKGYAYGLSKIYELVINNDPCYAYLMRQNAIVDQKLVMAHVCGHADFFKNNMWFNPTNRRMMDEMANHGNRIRSLAEKYGQDRVESFIDCCLSIDNLIDIYSPYITRHSKPKNVDPDSRGTEEELASRKLPSSDYMDRYVNPPEFLEQQRRLIEKEIQKQISFPAEPQRDILLFLLEHAPLKPWQRTVMSIVREEAYYFAPQGMTKIMNEGWASYWHSTLMTGGLLDDSEVVDYADRHAGTMSSGRGALNPYKVGIELFRNIEERWDAGQFGKEWEECDSLQRRQNWDLKLGKGKEKIFQVRRIYNDVTFIDEFLTPEFCEEHKMFVYDYNKQSGEYVISSRDFGEVKSKLLSQLVNFGQPVIVVENANYQNRGELYLRHLHEDTDLKMSLALDTLKNLHSIWSRPVHLETMVDSRRKLYSFDGKKHSDRNL
jgi:stage V sporulation protein R